MSLEQQSNIRRNKLNAACKRGIKLGEAKKKCNDRDQFCCRNGAQTTEVAPFVDPFKSRSASGKARIFALTQYSRTIPVAATTREVAATLRSARHPEKRTPKKKKKKVYTRVGDGERPTAERTRGMEMCCSFERRLKAS